MSPEGCAVSPLPPQGEWESQSLSRSVQHLTCVRRASKRQTKKVLLCNAIGQVNRTLVNCLAPRRSPADGPASRYVPRAPRDMFFRTTPHFRRDIASARLRRPAVIRTPPRTGSVPCAQPNLHAMIKRSGVRIQVACDRGGGADTDRCHGPYPRGSQAVADKVSPFSRQGRVLPVVAADPAVSDHDQLGSAVGRLSHQGTDTADVRVRRAVQLLGPRLKTKGGRQPFGVCDPGLKRACVGRRHRRFPAIHCVACRFQAIRPIGAIRFDRRKVREPS